MAQDLPISDAFYEKLARIVEANMEKEQFGVNELVQEVGLSHSQIHRKLKLLTGQTISKFIREIRLQRAHELLQDHMGTASEIGYKVGFSSPTYFNKCFKDFFGYSPGSIIRSELTPFPETVEGTVSLNAETESNPTLPHTVSKPSANKMKAFFIAGVLAILVFSYFLYTKLSASQETTGISTVITDKSIAVLPFRNDSPDSEYQYFCDGMMDEIRTHLQKIADLRVKSRTQVEPYRNSTKSFATIAQELNAAYLLEGAVRKYGNRFRITAQLIDVNSKNNMWAGSYDGTISDSIFIVQSSIAKEIVASLNAIITRNEKRSIDQFPTSNVAAYDLFIRATHERTLYWNTYQERHLRAAHDLIDKALKIDPQFLVAIIEKGGLFMAGKQYDSALIYADKVLALDPEYSYAFALKGDVYSFMGKADIALENLKKAISLPPGGERRSYCYLLIANIYANQKKDFISAIPYYKQGMARGLSADFKLGQILLYMGDYERADRYIIKTLRSKGNCFGIVLYHASLQIQGKIQQALQFNDSLCQELVDCSWACKMGQFRAAFELKQFEQAEQYYYQLQSDPSSGPFMYWLAPEMGYIQRQLEKKEESAKTLAAGIETLKSEMEKQYVYWHAALLSSLYAVNGNKADALKYLAIHAQEDCLFGHFDNILINPLFECLRDDPEFKAIVKQALDKRAAVRERFWEMQERGEIDL